jgi:hypothetical protein
VTAHRCKQLEFGEFVRGITEYLRGKSLEDFKSIYVQAIEKPQNWQAEAKCGLCQLAAAGNQSPLKATA